MKITKKQITEIQNRLSKISMLQRLIHLAAWNESKTSTWGEEDYVNSIRVIAPITNRSINEIGEIIDEVINKAYPYDDVDDIPLEDELYPIEQEVDDE